MFCLVMLRDSQTKQIFHFEYKIAFVIFLFVVFPAIFKITTEQSTTVIKGPIHTTPEEFQNITITGKSYEYRDAIVFENLRFRGRQA